MNEFYHSLDGTFFYRWVVLNEKEYKKHNIDILVKEDYDSHIIFFESEEKFGRVIVWFHDVIELQLFRKEDGSSCFYLHFEINNIGQCQYLFREFYHCLVKRTSGRRFRVLVCCTGGLTSCLFAAKLQELVDLKRYNIHLDATAYCYLKERYDTYDLILMAPQVAHHVPVILRNITRNIPVKNINAMEYATLNLDYTFDLICDFATRIGLLH